LEAQKSKILNPAGVSLLLSKLMVDVSAKAVGGQSADGAFCWIDGIGDELDQETLSELMTGVLDDPELLEWSATGSGVRRCSIDDFEADELLIYLITEGFALCVVVAKDQDVGPVDRQIDSIGSSLTGFM
jgi:hypothetical protein